MASPQAAAPEQLLHHDIGLAIALGRVEAKVDELAQRVDRRFATLESGVGEIKVRMGAMEERLERIEGQIGEILAILRRKPTKQRSARARK